MDGSFEARIDGGHFRSSFANRDAACVLLQDLMPGAKTLASGYRNLGTREEVASTVVAVMAETIRSYPFERRPERIAANVLGDTRHVLYQQARDRARITEAVGPLLSLDADVGEKAFSQYRHPADEVVSTVRQAIAVGAIDEGAGRMVIAHRVFDTSLSAFPELDGLADDTRRRHRLPAERALSNAAPELEMGFP